jgi:hypothetical protein
MGRHSQGKRRIESVEVTNDKAYVVIRTEPSGNQDMEQAWPERDDLGYWRMIASSG